MWKTRGVLSTLSFILLWMGWFSSVNAQEDCNLTLSGQIFDEHDGRPLPYADVYIFEAEKGGVSDTSGYYVISGLCPGTYTVRCTHIGCAPIVKKVELKKNTSFNFYPEHHSELLGEISIVSEKAPETNTQSQTTLSKEELEETRGQSLGQSLSKVSGVTTYSTGNSISKPVIHGLHSNRILILNNGIRQEGQQWGNEHAPEIDPFIADELTVIRGANSVRYGPDAIAGVILVEPKKLRDQPGIDGELNLVGFGNGRQGVASGMIDGNLKKIPGLSWRLQGTYKRGGNIKTPDYYMKNTGIEEKNFSWAAGYKKRDFGLEVFFSDFSTDIAIFSASHIGNLTDLQRAFDAEEPLEKSGFSYTIGRPWQHIDHTLIKATGYLYTGDAGKLSATFARQYNLREEYDKHLPLNDSLAGLNLPALHFEITTYTGDLTWEHAAIKNITGSIGVSGIHQGNTYRGRYFIPNFRKYGGGIFWIERWHKPSSKLQLEAGARYDYIYQQVFIRQGENVKSPEYAYSNINGNIGLIYTFNESLLVKGNLGSAWRPPNVSELYSNGLHHGAAAVEIGDTSLGRENSYAASATIEYTQKKLRVYTDFYVNYIRDFIYLKPEQPPTLTIRGAFPTFHYTQVDAVLKGMDLTLVYDLPWNFRYTGKVALLRAQNAGTKEYLVLMPADRYENTLEYRMPDKKKWHDAHISLTVLNVLKQWRVDPTIDFAPPPDGYCVLNLNAGFSVPAGAQKIDIGLSVNNLLNTVYRDYMNRFRYYADEMGTNVSLRIKVPFSIINHK